MNVRHPIGVLHSFSIKNIFHDKMDLRVFYFRVTIYMNLISATIHIHKNSQSEITLQLQNLIFPVSDVNSLLFNCLQV